MVPLFQRRALGALQVEVTSRCTRRCAVCPRSALARDWLEGDLTTGSWDRLRPDLGRVRHLHLQGWGEPLLHPGLSEMVRDARGAGCAVGLTTNGDLLGEAAGWIVDAGVARVTVSVAGDAAAQAELRDGSSVERVWEAVERLAALRGRRRTPRIQIGYLLTRRNVEPLPGVVDAAARHGADEIFVTHLDCLPVPELAGLAAFGPQGLAPAAEAALAAAERTARERGIAFRGPARAPEEMLVCAHDPLRFVYVAQDGRVGPCVNQLLPLRGSVPCHGPEGPGKIAPAVFGTLAHAGLGEILDGPERRRFNRAFVARLEAERRFRAELLDVEWGVEALERLEASDRRRAAALARHPFPPSCAGCPKSDGW